MIKKGGARERNNKLIFGVQEGKIVLKCLGCNGERPSNNDQNEDILKTLSQRSKEKCGVEDNDDDDDDDDDGKGSKKMTTNKKDILLYRCVFVCFFLFLFPVRLSDDLIGDSTLTSPASSSPASEEGKKKRRGGGCR